MVDFGPAPLLERGILTAVIVGGLLFMIRRKQFALRLASGLAALVPIPNALLGTSCIRVMLRGHPS